MPKPDKKFRVQRANGIIINEEIVDKCTAIWWRDVDALKLVIEAYKLVFDYWPKENITETDGDVFLKLLQNQISNTIRRASEIKESRKYDVDLPE